MTSSEIKLWVIILFPNVSFYPQNPPKLTTIVTVDVQLQKLSKSIVWNKVPDGSTLIIRDTRIPFQHNVDQAEVAATPKMSAIRPAVSIQYRHVTDRHMTITIVLAQHRAGKNCCCKIFLYFAAMSVHNLSYEGQLKSYTTPFLTQVSNVCNKLSY